MGEVRSRKFREVSRGKTPLRLDWPGFPVTFHFSLAPIHLDVWGRSRKFREVHSGRPLPTGLAGISGHFLFFPFLPYIWNVWRSGVNGKSRVLPLWTTLPGTNSRNFRDPYFSHPYLQTSPENDPRSSVRI